VYLFSFAFQRIETHSTSASEFEQPATSACRRECARNDVNERLNALRGVHDYDQAAMAQQTRLQLDHGAGA
jgi:hypothetical protein